MVEKEKTKKEFEELLLEVRKVTRVTTGGRRMSFRATVLVGNKKGKIGLGLAKGVDVTSAVKKATNEAYKTIFLVPITKDKTVPYSILNKYKSCIVKILPAAQGTGLKAGSSVRSVLDLAGYENILSKIIGSNNKLNNAIASINALSKYKYAEHFAANIMDTDKKEEMKDKVEKKPEQVEKADKKGDEVKKVATKKTVAKDSTVAKKSTEKVAVKDKEKKPAEKKATATKKATTTKKTVAKKDK